MVVCVARDGYNRRVDTKACSATSGHEYRAGDPRGDRTCCSTEQRKRRRAASFLLLPSCLTVAHLAGDSSGGGGGGGAAGWRRHCSRAAAAAGARAAAAGVGSGSRGTSSSSTSRRWWLGQQAAVASQQATAAAAGASSGSGGWCRRRLGKVKRPGQRWLLLREVRRVAAPSPPPSLPLPPAVGEPGRGGGWRRCSGQPRQGQHRPRRLGTEECDYLKAIARPRLQISTVVDTETGKATASTSSGAPFNGRADSCKSLLKEGSRLRRQRAVCGVPTQVALHPSHPPAPPPEVPSLADAAASAVGAPRRLAAGRSTSAPPHATAVASSSLFLFSSLSSEGGFHHRRRLCKEYGRSRILRARAGWLGMGRNEETARDRTRALPSPPLHLAGGATTAPLAVHRDYSLPINVDDDEDDADADDDDLDLEFTAAARASRRSYAEEDDRRRGMGTSGFA
ncbi:hypothetical protein Taro_003752 [Colocasia esculenta]|uniref:Uncharacterized protein n=1 Tax=Colocasia esculenta TaxID=4460 RepID=A0A843TKK6_COLES|nr:hypothetical protein [Colocasia esculenta]